MKHKRSGTSCSKLKTPLVNETFELKICYTQNIAKVAEGNVCRAKGAHFFQQKY